MNVDYKLIGERIQKTRKSKGMTQDVLAEKLGVSIGYVSQVERGITKISLHRNTPRRRSLTICIMAQFYYYTRHPRQMHKY